jgi:hypothetical protein
MLLHLAAPADNVRGPRYMQEALAAFHQANRRNVAVTLEYGNLAGRAGLFCRVPEAVAPLFTGPLQAKYPNCTLAVLEDHQVPPLDAAFPETCSAELTLTPDLYPLLRHSQFEDISSGTFEDPIDALLQAITPDEQTRARIQFHVRPTSWLRQWRSRHAVFVLDAPIFRTHEDLARVYARGMTNPYLWPFFLLLTLRRRTANMRFRSEIDFTGGRHHEREDDVQSASDKVGGHLFDVRIRLVVQAAPNARRHVEDRLQAMIGALGSLTASRLATFRVLRRRPGVPRAFRRGGFLLSHEELATLFHPPTAGVSVEKLSTCEFTELEAPTSFHSEESEGAVVTLGRVRFRDDQREVRLGGDARRRHLYIVGRTGVGKSTLLLNILAADIAAGHGAGLLDPHGDLAEALLAAIPPHRTNDVILFDPSDDAFAIGFNPLSCPDPARRDLVADDVLSAMNKIYDLSQTPRLKDTLRNALYVLIEQGETLVSLLLLLSDARYRERVAAQVEDDVARLFWTREFPTWSERYRTEAMSAIQNKVRPFLMNRNVRAILGQKGKTLNLRRVMDEGKVLIANLSKGRIGEDNANLLGSLLVSSIQQAAMSRAGIPEEDRRDFFLTVDEFQNYRTGSFASILSEARKYRLCLTMGHQYLKQLDFETADAVFGNVGSLLTFQVTGDDAEVLSRQLSQYPGQVRPADVANLPKYTAYARLLIDGMPSRPFSLATLPPPAVPIDGGRASIVRAASHRRYAAPAALVHEQIRKELAVA